MAHPDLEKLLNALLPFAQQMLQKHGEFYPFGASMQADGTISMIGAQVDGNEFPESAEVIALLEEGFRTGAKDGKIKALGMCTDVRVVVPGGSEKTDAIQANLEHSEAGAVSVFLPYKKGFLGKMSYGQIFASSASPRIFVPKQQ
jgi:hypothetical protein